MKRSIRSTAITVVRFVMMSYESSITIVETNDAGEATKIQHFKHMHSLMLSPFVEGCERSCEGCMLPISDPFYDCSRCDFFLHKACAELTKKKHVWHHSCREPLVLTSENIFKCEECRKVSSAFSYECRECKERICFQCVIALTPGAHTCSKYGDPVFYYKDYEKKCNACGFSVEGGFRFKNNCHFLLDRECFSLPITARHKCDEHLLSLTYVGGNSYSGSHYSDIYEGSQDPNPWFYHYATCDTSGHVHCALGKYPFVKPGSKYKEELDHPHPELTFVKKKYYYPDCEKCGKPCEDLGLECAQSGCNYIVHWDCVTPSNLKGDPLWRWWRDV